MTAQQLNYSNFFETTLAAIVGASDNNLTLAVAPTSNGSSAISPPFYLVIDPDNETNKEVVLVTAASGTNMSTVTRDVEGRHGTDPSHVSGTVVRMAVVGQMFDDLETYVDNEITTIITGFAASMGSILSLAADKGKRFAMPQAKIMIHQPMLMGYQGKAADCEIQAKEILKTREQLDEILAHHTGQTTEKIRLDADRDYFMRPEAALEYGIIDQVAHPRSELDQEEITEPDN